MHTPKRLIHTIASCNNCDWQEGDYRTAAKLATVHARANPGHVITVEQGYSYKVTKQ